jgi:hypothetical protein
MILRTAVRTCELQQLSLVAEHWVPSDTAIPSEVRRMQLDQGPVEHSLGPRSAYSCTAVRVQPRHPVEHASTRWAHARRGPGYGCCSTGPVPAPRMVGLRLQEPASTGTPLSIMK